MLIKSNLVKISFAITLFSTITSCDSESSQEVTKKYLYPFEKDELIGYCDEKGREVIEPKFVYAGAFSEGLAPATTVEDSGISNVLYGYINEQGEFAIEPKFTYPRNFSGGLAAITTPDGNSGYINKEGKIVISVENETEYGSPQLNMFFNGKAMIQQETKIAFINTNGEEVNKNTSYQGSYFSNNLMPILEYKDRSYIRGYANSNGETVIKHQFSHADSFSEGLAVVSTLDTDGKYGYINSEGEVVINFDYHSADAFSEGLALVRKGGKKAYINKKGETEISVDYLEASAFSGGLAKVRNSDRKYGYIDKKGELVIPFQYSKANSFFGDLAQVSISSVDSYIYIDKTGQRVCDVGNAIHPSSQLIINDDQDTRFKVLKTIVFGTSEPE